MTKHELIEAAEEVERQLTEMEEAGSYHDYLHQKAQALRERAMGAEED